MRGTPVWTLVLIFSFSLPFGTARALAEDRSNAKVGLVLSGGGARGAAHIGVLKVLERERIPIDYIVGTSFGALVGGLYALGYTAEAIERVFLEQNWNSLFSGAPERRLAPLVERRNYRYLAELSFNGWTPELPTGLLGEQRLTEVLDYLTSQGMVRAEYNFDRLPIPFRAVATNLLDGKPYVFRDGPMTEALRASIAVPMLFTPVRKDDMLLVDGGLSDNLPTDVMRDWGADIIIAVDATSPLLKQEQIKNFVDVMDQSISLLMDRTKDQNRELADIVIHPKLEGYGYADYGKVAAILELGQQEGEECLPRIRDLVAAIPPREKPSWTETPTAIQSIQFRGLRKISSGQLFKETTISPGDLVSPSRLRADVGRLYATRLFNAVDYKLAPLDAENCQLIYTLEEARLKSLGASIRYDRNYKFIALLEFNARQLFGTPSRLTLSTQFGGIENHEASLRLIPAPAPFLFVEPGVYVRRRERFDFRGKDLVDRFTDERDGGQILFGGSFLRHIEIALGYHDESVTIDGGQPPFTQTGEVRSAGPTLRVFRDTLDDQEFPRSGMNIRLHVDRHSKKLGGDLEYTRARGDFSRYFSFNTATIGVTGTIGYSQGELPFFDRFYVGGFTLSEGGPRQFLGLDRDEVAAARVAALGVSFRKLLFSHPLGLAKRGFLAGYYNGLYYTTDHAPRYRYTTLHGAGIDFAIETVLGPVHIAAGWAEEGRFKFYISLGPGF